MKNNNRRAFLEKALFITGSVALNACNTTSTPNESKPKAHKKTTNLEPSVPTSSPLPDGLEQKYFTLHNPKPLALEALRNTIGISPITATKRLFVRNNLPRPNDDIIKRSSEWTVHVNGVQKPRSFTLSQLQQIGTESITAVLQCSGNGRAFFTHGPSGSPWATGAAGCVIWTGVKLSDVFRACGEILPKMKYLTATGGEPLPKDVPRNKAVVERSIPIEKAQRDCILAWELNGEPIPISHGGPLRLIVPGYFGCNQIKYVQEITAATEQSLAKIQQSGYRFRPVGNKGALEQPSMWRMPVKSWIVSSQQNTFDETHILHGVAFSGERGIQTVEYSANGISWEKAQLYGPDLGPNAWRCFRIHTDKEESPRTIYTRATDTQGESQPKERVENERGYGNNSWLDHAFALITQQPIPQAQQEKQRDLTEEQKEQGKKVFLNESNPSCGTCHTLADAQTKGQIGPNLDQLKPDSERVQRAVTNGVGAMPSYGQQLTKEQIQSISDYVSHVTKP